MGRGNIILPEEIVVEVLSRLPLDSLIRFTCVSKEWRSLISDISAAKTGPPTVLLLSDWRADSFSPQSINRNVHVKSVYVPWNMDENMINKFICRFRVLGSCNGLLLIQRKTIEDLFLWNPLTRFFKKMLAYDRLCDENNTVSSGLCYDSTHDEYKAVLALYRMTPGFELVVVGSFRSKSWTRIGFPYVVPTVNSGPIFNGNLHWYASKKDSGWPRFLSPHQIIYFNAHMEKFEEVPMPEPRGEDGDIMCGLGVLNGYLCMTRSDCPGNSESNVQVLIMNEYGVENSWAILCVVSRGFLSHVYDTLVPLGYTKNGEVLTKVSPRRYGCNLWAFNLTNNCRRRISVPEYRYSHVLVHEESLIVPTDYGWEEEELKGEATYVEHTHITRKMKKGKDGYWTREYIKSEP